MSINIIIVVSLILIFGLLSTRLMKIVRLPNVTGYLIVGLLIGPFLWKMFLTGDTGLITEADLKSLSIITDIALGFIAFSIGAEFKWSSLKKIGKKIVVITFFQALGAVILVDGALLILVALDVTTLPVALCLGAIATATAPAATLMVVRQYKAKGPLVDTLLPVVAFDDAIGLVIFAISFAIAKTIASGAPITIYEIAIKPLLEVIFSLGIGLVLGVILTYSMKLFKSRANRLCLMVALVSLGTGLCIMLEGFSSLLTCMMIGAVFANLRKDSNEILDGCDRWTPPLFMIFFVISGANLDLSLIPAAGIVGVVYLVARSLGKYFGAFLGCSVTHSDKKITRYLGLTLLPQAGVAIGMATIVAQTAGFEAYASTITTVVLCATFIYELVGPFLTKFALGKAGEIPSAKNKESKKEPLFVSENQSASSEALTEEQKNINKEDLR